MHKMQCTAYSVSTSHSKELVVHFKTPSYLSNIVLLFELAGDNFLSSCTWQFMDYL